MSTFYHHPTEPRRQLVEGQPCPEGWTGPHTEEESAAWADDWKSRYVPPAKTYSEKDYEVAIDGMLQTQCKAHAGYTFDDITKASSYASRPGGHYYPASCWFADLRDYSWWTAEQMSKQPPSGTPPTPDELAAYLLSAFTATNPFPA